MRYLVLLVSAVWLAIGITVAYEPLSVSKWLVIEELGIWMKVLALVPLFFGIVLILGSLSLRLAVYLRVIGVLAVFKGLFILFAPASIVGNWFGWFMGQPVWAIRALALFSIALAGIVAVVAIIALFEEDVI